MFIDDMLDKFYKYLKSIRDKFFWSNWKKDILDTTLMKNRGKRMVYRFILYMESKDAAYFWVYPSCFKDWVKKDSKFSMYPADGVHSRPMIPWEILHCPWYLESDNYSIVFNKKEKNYFVNISKKVISNTIFNALKLSSEIV